MTNTSEIESNISNIQSQVDQAVAEQDNLVYSFISEDMKSWLDSGGCLRCNGAGSIYYWKESSDIITCPECDGQSVDYTLSYVFSRSNPKSYYFPEIDPNLASRRYADPYYGVKMPEKLVFWNPQRVATRDRLNSKINQLKSDLVKARNLLAEEARAKSVKESKQQAVSPNTLPSLVGVSRKQVGFAVACRSAASEKGLANNDMIASNTSASYWIDNFKHLLGR